MFAELDGNRVAALTLILPAKGIWTADVLLDQNAAMNDTSVTLTLNTFSLKGTIFRAGNFVGAASFRIVGGAGGWRKPLPAKFYQSGAGVRLSSLVTDTAREAGEQVAVLADRTVGTAFTRQRGPAVRVLGLLGDQWWVRPIDGVTVVGERANPVIVSQFDTLAQGTSLALGRVMVATDAPQDWQPGAVFSSPTLSARTISGAIHRLDANSLRTEVWIAA